MSEELTEIEVPTTVIVTSVYQGVVPVKVPAHISDNADAIEDYIIEVLNYDWELNHEAHKLLVVGEPTSTEYTVDYEPEGQE